MNMDITKQSIAIRLASWGAALLLLMSVLQGRTAEASAAPELPRKVNSQVGAAAPMEYVLAPKDVVMLRVLDEPELETRAIISEDGRVFVPLMGVVQLGGKTVEQATTSVREALGKDYLVNPQVILSVIESDKQQAAQMGFTVLGQVNRPGLYPLPLDKPINLLGAIAIAGGYTRMAAPSKVTVSRKVSGQVKIFKVDAEAIAKDSTAKSFDIQADDTIIVGERLL